MVGSLSELCVCAFVLGYVCEFVHMCCVCVCVRVCVFIHSCMQLCSFLCIRAVTNRGVSRIFIIGFPSVRIYRNIFRISSDQLLTI